MTTPHQPTIIKYALALRGYKQTDVARECDVEPTTVGAVINGRSRSQRIERRIAAITGMPLAELWPQWHGPSARRSRRPTMSHAQVVESLRAAAPARAVG